MLQPRLGNILLCAYISTLELPHQRAFHSKVARAGYFIEPAVESLVDVDVEVEEPRPELRLAYYECTSVDKTGLCRERCSTTVW